MARTLINVPPKAKRGDIVEIKTLISHEMETGYRPDNVGRPVPRDIITLFVATYNGEEIFRAELSPGDRRQSVHLVLRRSRPKAARSSSNGPATTALRRAKARASRWNEPAGDAMIAERLLSACPALCRASTPDCQAGTPTWWTGQARP